MVAMSRLTEERRYALRSEGPGFLSASPSRYAVNSLRKVMEISGSSYETQYQSGRTEDSHSGKSRVPQNPGQGLDDILHVVFALDDDLESRRQVCLCSNQVLHSRWSVRGYNFRVVIERLNVRMGLQKRPRNAHIPISPRYGKYSIISSCS